MLRSSDNRRICLALLSRRAPEQLSAAGRATRSLVRNVLRASPVYESRTWFSWNVLSARIAFVVLLVGETIRMCNKIRICLFTGMQQEARNEAWKRKAKLASVASMKRWKKSTETCAVHGKTTALRLLRFVSVTTRLAYHTFAGRSSQTPQQILLLLLLRTPNTYWILNIVF